MVYYHPRNWQIVILELQLANFQDIVGLYCHSEDAIFNQARLVVEGHG